MSLFLYIAPIVFVCLFVCLLFVAHTDHVDDAVMAVFQYLAMMKQEGNQEWIFKECAVCEHTHKNRQCM